jgi:hypothetical protein
VPAVSGGLPRLADVQAWDTSHLTTAAQHWADSATRWEDGFAEVARHSFSPGGSVWEGAAATAAQDRAVADRTQVNRVAERLRTVSADARIGATELSAARQQVLAAVNAARAAGFEVSDDLSVTYVDDGSPTSAARRTQAEGMARDIWQRAAKLTATDRDVAQRISAASGEIQSLSFGPGQGGLPEDTPNEMLGVHNAEDVHDIVDPLPPGEQENVRQLPTSAEIRALYGVLTENGTLATPPTYPGTSYLLEDGTRISMRETSSSGGTTIDIKYPDGYLQKVHLPPGGEQQQSQPAPEEGFLDTVGGIAIGILGGLGWVGSHLAHPLSPS